MATVTTNLDPLVCERYSSPLQRKQRSITLLIPHYSHYHTHGLTVYAKFVGLARYVQQILEVSGEEPQLNSIKCSAKSLKCPARLKKFSRTLGFSFHSLISFFRLDSKEIPILKVVQAYPKQFSLHYHAQNY